MIANILLFPKSFFSHLLFICYFIIFFVCFKRIVLYMFYVCKHVILFIVLTDSTDCGQIADNTVILKWYSHRFRWVNNRLSPTFFEKENTLYIRLVKALIVHYRFLNLILGLGRSTKDAWDFYIDLFSLKPSLHVITSLSNYILLFCWCHEWPTSSPLTL